MHEFRVRTRGGDRRNRTDRLVMYGSSQPHWITVSRERDEVNFSRSAIIQIFLVSRDQHVILKRTGGGTGTHKGIKHVADLIAFCGLCTV